MGTRIDDELQPALLTFAQQVADGSFQFRSETIAHGFDALGLRLLHPLTGLTLAERL